MGGCRRGCRASCGYEPSSVVPREHRGSPSLRAASSVLEMDHRVLHPASLRSLHLREDNRFLRPPDLLATDRWLRATVGDFTDGAPALARSTRAALLDAQHLRVFCQRLLQENANSSYYMDHEAETIVLRGSATPITHLNRQRVRRALGTLQVCLERPEMDGNNHRGWTDNQGSPLQSPTLPKEGRKITISGLPYIINDAAIIRTLRPYCQVASIAHAVDSSRGYTWLDLEKTACIATCSIQPPCVSGCLGTDVLHASGIKVNFCKTQSLCTAGLAALPIIQLLGRWFTHVSIPISISLSSLRRCAFRALPTSARESCIACGSGGLSLAHRNWSCMRIRPVILEAFNIIQRPPDLQGWIFRFGHGLKENTLAILVSVKTCIYKNFLGLEMRRSKKTPSWSGGGSYQVSSAELKKLRTPVRAMFTKAFNELETEIKKNEVKKADVEKILRRFQTHHEKLSILNTRMEEALLRESASEDIFSAEYESVCEYEDNFSNIMTDYDALAKKEDVSTISGTAAMNYRLPKLELKKFGGEPSEWITFWSQFSTIDRDPQMPPETKYQYLFQATAENSEAREAVESFPPSADNYPKVIEYIKSRFGEDEMLVEIYVRDLLQNVLQNVRAEGKMSVVKLYDRLETQLRALETLGVARDKFAAMLYPLVESALPEDTLRVWERSQYTVSGRGVQDKLTQLMTFLKTEVKGESRVNMAKAAFKIDNNQDVKDDRSNRKSLSKKNTEIKCRRLLTSPTPLRCETTASFVGRVTRVKNATVDSGCIYQRRKIGLKGRMFVFGACFLATDSRNAGLSHVALSAEENITPLCRSYISKRMVDALGLKRVQQVTLTHNLFGGGEIRQKKHNVYKVNVSSLNSEYMDDLKFLDQEVICGHISQVQDDTILNELKARGINLTDICQGEHNPADIPSRGESPSKFTKSGWWEGPKWLQEKKEDWPVSKVQYDLEAIEEERRKTVVTGFVAKKPEENPWYLNLYEGKREVTLPQILRVIAWMLRFKPSEYKGDIISQEELDSAEKSLVKIIQSESIGEEDPKMKQLHAFQDKEGLWRVKTRIVNRNDDELFRLPILIPTNHPVTKLIVKSVHEKMYHCGAQTLRSVLREKFWIRKARQLVRHVIHKCPRCRRFETKRVDVPETSLPQHRVRDVVVFEVTGIDLGGPLYLEDGQKVWFVIFTCGVYRAVHLELVTSLSTEALVGAVERFVARRGCPAVIYSDNGTNLVGLRNELYRVNFGVKWKLNPPAAPWWGGWIEIIVGLTKKLLRGWLGKRVVNYEEMVTILGNCERVINARPLTYIAEDNDDLVPLTPEMFLREPRTEGEIDLNEFRCNFGKSYEKRKRLLKEFRKRFRSEYLGLLVHHDNRRKQRQLKVGDIVLVEVENRKQINWPMGKITRVFPGTDNVRRLVEVKTKSGFMKRAVQRLFPLEVPSEDVEQDDRELKPAEDEIVWEKTPGVESVSVQEKTTPSRVKLRASDVSMHLYHSSSSIVHYLGFVKQLLWVYVNFLQGCGNENMWPLHYLWQNFILGRLMCHLPKRERYLIQLPEKKYLVFIKRLPETRF
ncbi:hypothetical protein LAZ67_16002164 [Cordylochernes scorpioides]|uniref:Integrase catalytic domain-containing protein n=1 Tax=Cordylochernes scorpioides TaxID=51811 RepID=A0ABY6LFE0_9ARAC|nr:hypothetical protein LAZ67_16002164 [Cordylochernes scorpioides]